MSTHAAFRPQAGGVAAGSSRTSQGKAPATGSKSIPRTRPSHAGTDDDEGDDDPIIASYPVYLNNSLTNPPSEQQGVPSRSLYILNHVTRIVAANGDSAPPTAPQRLPPATAVRIKPREGILEMDLLPYDTAAAGSGSAPGTISGGEYDRARGLAWGGTMLRRAAATGSGRSVGAGGGSAGLGLAGGFGVGMVAPGGGGGGGGGRRGPAASSATKVEMELEEDDDYDMSIVEDPMEVAAARMGPAEWERALAEHRALRIQTVAGQIPREPGYTKTMIGVFHKGSLHLTPVTATIAVRPQLHHIDATNEQEGPRGGGGGMARAGNAATAASASSVSTAPGPATRAINMTIKSAAMASQDDGNAGGGGSSNAAGGDADDRSSSRAAAQQPTESITDRLRSIQAEPWRHLTYVDEDDETAWDAFREHLVVHPAPSDEGGEQEEDGLPRLAVSWTGEDMLAAVCRMPRKQRRDEEQGQPAAGDADAVVAGGQSSTAAPTVGTAAATAPKTGGAKGKGILKKGSATSSGPAAAATAAAGPAVPDAATADEPAAAAPKRGRPRGGSAAASTVGRAPASTRGGRGGARGGGRGGSASGA